MHSISIRLEQAEREILRWDILVALDKKRPELLSETLLSEVVRSPSTRSVEPNILRRQLDYLEQRGLVRITKKDDKWYARLTWRGIDVVEYTVDVFPGISRPENK